MLPGLTVSILRLKLVRVEVDEGSTLVVEEVGELKQVWSQKPFSCFLLPSCERRKVKHKILNQSQIELVTIPG